MQIFMAQSSVFKRNKFAFFVFSFMRNKLIICFVLVLFMCSCGNINSDPVKNAPKFEIKVQRFDSAFFSMDTVQLKQSISNLIKKYPSFSLDFINRVLMLKKIDDTLAIKAFYRIYLPIYKEVQNVNAIKTAQPELEDAFTRLQYFFPNYKLSHNVILFVGPLESYGNIVTTDAIAIGLQMHMGSSSKWYYDAPIQNIYPSYLTRRYTPNYIAVSSVQNILSDIYIPSNKAQTLVEQMIEAGKIQYIINACFPKMADSIKLGYTNDQCINLKNQTAQVWAYILHEKLLYSTNPSDIDNFMQDAESSNVFGEAMPGNIGKYIGLNIVSAWMNQQAQKQVTMQQMLDKPANKIFEEASYNP